MKPYRSLWILWIVVAALYGRTLGYEFLNLDDNVNIENNPYLNPPTWENVGHFWLHPYKHLYIPLTYTVWAGVATFWKSNPMPFHLLNLLLFTFSVSLIFLILKRLRFGESACLAGALLFAIHPIQVESVAWITSMKGLLSGTLFFLALYLYLLSIDLVTGERKSSEKYWTGWGVFLLALLSKTTVLVLPLLLTVLCALVLKQPRERWTKPLRPWFFLSGAFVLIGMLAYGHGQSAAPPHPASVRPFIALDSLVFYLYKVLLPFSLTVDYGRPVDQVAQGISCLLTSMLAIALGIGCFNLYRHRRQQWPLITLALFALALLPVLGLKPHDMQLVTTTSDRYVFLALFGFSVGCAAIVHKGGKKARFAMGGIGLILAFLTWRQVPYWKDNFALFNHLLDINPKSWLAQNNLASAYETASRLPEALDHYTRSATLKPMPETFNSMGIIHMKQGDLPGAAEVFSKAVTLTPSATLFNNWGIVLIQLKKPDEARQAFQRAVQLDPSLAQAIANLQRLQVPGARRH